MKSEIKNIAERIAFYRKQKGWTHNRLAEAVGFSRNTIVRYENGESTPSYGKLIELAAALELDPLLLIADKELADYLREAGVKS